MRAFLVIVSVLVVCGSLCAASTPFIGVEITSATLPQQPGACAQSSLAQTSDGFVLAYWDGGIDLVSLDRSLVQVGAPRRISSAGFLATCPSVAAAAGHTVLAWKESETGVVFARIAADGLLQGPAGLGDVSRESHPIVLADAESDWIAAGSVLYQIHRTDKFTATAPMPAARAAWQLRIRGTPFANEALGVYDSIARNGDLVAGTAHALGNIPERCSGGFVRICVGPFTYSSVAFSEGGAAPREIWSSPQQVIARSATACANGTCAIASFDAPSSSGARPITVQWSSDQGAAPYFIGEAAFPFGREQNDVGIAAASDGDRILFVWQTWNRDRFEIAGVELTRSSTGQPFIIASGKGDRIRPAVIALAHNRFVVHYEIASNSTTRLGRRFIDWNPPVRRRIAR